MARNIEVEMFEPNFKNKTNAYLYANKIILFFLVFIFIYVVVVNVFQLNINCQYRLTVNRECFSCGLTRGLYKCMLFDFFSANLLNKNSFFFFLFGITQFGFRIFISFFLSNKKYSEKYKCILFFDLMLFSFPLILKIYSYG